MKESRSSRATRTAGKAAKHAHPLVSCRISVFWEGENKYFRVRSFMTIVTLTSSQTLSVELPHDIPNIHSHLQSALHFHSERRIV
jgi:hypothetical protein